MHIRRDRNDVIKDVVSELEAFVQRSSQDVSDEATRYCLFFNNFNLNLPCLPSRRGGTQPFLDNPEMSKENGKTLRQFYDDIDKAIGVCGIDTQLMTQLASQSIDMEKRKELYELILPVYAELLAEGYSVHDLIG